MTDLRYFENAKKGYYQASWVDDKGHVCGWIPKRFGSHVDSIDKIPESWVEPPFFAALFDLNDVHVVASSLSELLKIQQANDQVSS